MKHLIICILFFHPLVTILSQDKHDFSVELNVNGSYHDMKLANQFMSEDPAYTWMSVSSKKSSLNMLDFGLDYYLGINYQPLDFMDFGIFANYQSSTIKQSYSYKEYVDPLTYPDSTVTRNGRIRTETSALTLGVSSNLYINKLLHFDQTNSAFLKKVILSIGIKGGMGFSTFSERAGTYNNVFDYYNFQYKATNFNGRAELGIGYPLFNKSLFSSIGVKIGYQFFKTSPLKNYADVYLYPANDPGTKVSLDFSGLYYGVYFKIGKH